MTFIIKRCFLAVLGVAALSTLGVAKTPSGWVDNVDAAFVQAKKENKSMLLLFTGSDFCPPCILMEKKVFSKDDFLSQVSKSFILVYIDFPKSNPKLDEANTKYYDKYEVEGYPTVILMTPNEEEFGRFDASEFPTVERFLTHIADLKEKSQLDR